VRRNTFAARCRVSRRLECASPNLCGRQLRVFGVQEECEGVVRGLGQSRSPWRAELNVA
jgi:hypothetical protein